ncbi:lef-4 [Clostera anachoreta granulovirus]|uniref:Lef-4 n=1 Tax=Clostera anachoreta granulovirus TaxID=283675 RepID=F4ZKV7_9BBAC|nr:lef-4 [Clostera anachoreta granulovirus]AEB00368.1 lef-4 [Clostera anachoreta granulovirus]
MENFTLERELSYTLAYSQDVLYRLKCWLDANFTVNDEYVEVIDDLGVRTRLKNGKVISQIKKKCEELNRVVVPVRQNLVPIIVRECHEIYSTCCVKLRRVTKTRVYVTPDGVEVKFEQIYHEHNLGDLLDPLTASKQIQLLNALTPDDRMDLTINSHVGSDEILANCRLEFEFEGELNQTHLIKFASVVNNIEDNVLGDVIVRPFLSHTSIINDICYRTFVEERFNTDCVKDVKMWALKLDGVRGKAYVVNGRDMYVQLDDMQMFGGVLHTDKFESVAGSNSNLLHNRVVGLQVEYVTETRHFYITDVLMVFRYKYDNKNQYDVATGVCVDLADAITFIKDQTQRFTFVDNIHSIEYAVTFQQYHAHRNLVDKTLGPHDGMVGIIDGWNLVKIKSNKTFEMLHAGDGVFKCSFGEFVCEEAGSWVLGDIYEVVILYDNRVKVIKPRPDRLLSN